MTGQVVVADYYSAMDVTAFVRRKKRRLAEVVASISSLFPVVDIIHKQDSTNETSRSLNFEHKSTTPLALGSVAHSITYAYTHHMPKRRH